MQFLSRASKVKFFRDSQEAAGMAQFHVSSPAIVDCSNSKFILHTAPYKSMSE